jgi:glycerol-3-phosphate acyltransferase PlsY
MKVLFVLIAYLLGAFPTGYLLVRLKARRDIREVGSGSTGATNVLRYGGWKMAIPVMVLDVLKGYLPALLAVRLFSDYRLALLSVLAAVIGHCFPVYLGFRGGKGVATSVGGFLFLSPGSLAISLIITLTMLAIFRYVSLATLTGLLILPFMIILIDRNLMAFQLACLIFILVLIRHKDNIRRLISGTERKFGEKVDG